MNTIVFHLRASNFWGYKKDEEWRIFKEKQEDKRVKRRSKGIGIVWREYLKREWNTKEEEEEASLGVITSWEHHGGNEPMSGEIGCVKKNAILLECHIFIQQIFQS